MRIIFLCLLFRLEEETLKFKECDGRRRMPTLIGAFIGMVTVQRVAVICALEFMQRTSHWKLVPVRVC